MSARIDQIIEVIEEVRGNFIDASHGISITQTRIDAVHSVATRRGIRTNSVSDKYLRQLSPDVISTSQFDSLLKDWLIDGSEGLRDVVLKHAIDAQDRRLIESAFYIATQQEILLSEEFGVDAAADSFQEGKEKLRIHLAKERNKYLIELAKEMWRKGGDLRCSICSFSFSDAYGSAGDGYIEAHHITPISELKGSTAVKPVDLVPVCSNCHGIIHRHRPWLTIEQMRKIVSDHGKSERK